MEPDMLLPRGAVGWAIGRWNCIPAGTALYTTTECTDYPSYNWLPSRALLVAGSAALLYFLFEGGPCHWTRLAETYYLIVCLTICSLALILALNRNLDGRAQVAFDITRLLALLVAMRIYVSAVSLTNLKPFYAVGDQRPFAAGQMTISDDNSLMAHRVVQQLETHLTHLIIQRETGILHPKVFPVVLLPLLFLQQECISYFGIAWALYWPVKATWIILVAFWMIVEIPRITRRLHTLAEVKQLLTHLLQHGDRELIHEVYRRANLASLFQATTFEVHELLVEDALNRGLLDPFSKAMLINGMQKYGVNNRRLDYVRDLIKSCKNYDLTVLKSILDSTGDYNSLHKLVYNDIRCKRTREEVLYHIAQEASATRSGWGPVGLKVVSDIDDTLLCSGARFPAGCDSRIPRHMVYPGCLQLFKELDRSWNADEPSSNLVFLSARPHVYKDLSESKARGWATGGDLLAGQLMQETDESSEAGRPRLKAVMIHEVLHDEDCLSLDPRPHPPHWRSQLADQGVHLFTSPLLLVLALPVAFMGGDPGTQRTSTYSERWKEDPNDPRWKGRKFEWFFTEKDEDLKLSSLPRPGFLPPEFWEAFYEKGIFIAVFQGATLIGGFIVIFQFAPYVINGILSSILGIGPK
ncbi:unnamed protein product [Effrenium voratum]|nr:unnamed protein product [Effrenium voratum]